MIASKQAIGKQALQDPPIIHAGFHLEARQAVHALLAQQ